jgi:hypothetical protein
MIEDKSEVPQCKLPLVVTNWSRKSYEGLARIETVLVSGRASPSSFQDFIGDFDGARQCMGPPGLQGRVFIFFRFCMIQSWNPVDTSFS